MRRVVAFVATVIMLLGATVNVPTASADVTCKKRNLRTGVCLISTTDSGAKQSDEENLPPEKIKHVGKLRQKSRVCSYGGQKLPCQDGSGGIWSTTHSCYLKRMSTQPPKSDPAWDGHTTGALYLCYLPEDDPYSLWLATPPDLQPRPDPRVLAQQAVAAMGLRAIDIGIVPRDRPGSVGVVGLPTWMWAADPADRTWGPIRRTASAAGYSVTAIGRVDRVVWSLGDGSTVVCRKPGTPYAASFGKRSSPDCGHTYVRQGTYTVRATSYWVVAWAGIGETGTIPIDFTQSTVITMGEVQVLTR